MFTFKDGFWLYAMETEGMDFLVNTKTAKLNAVIKEIRGIRSPSIDQETFEQILHRHGLSLSTLTQKEILYIQDGIRHR